MICPNCGMELDEGQSTCPLCGYLFSTKEPTTPFEQTPPKMEPENQLEETFSDEASPVKAPTQKPKKQKGKNRILLIVIILAIVLVGLTVLSVAVLKTNKEESSIDSNAALTTSTETATEIETTQGTEKTETVEAAETTISTTDATTTTEATTETTSTTELTLDAPILGDFVEEPPTNGGEGSVYVISWDTVDGANCYEYFVEKTEDGETYTIQEETTDLFYSTSSSVEMTVCIKVRACAYDTNENRVYSDWSNTKTITLNAINDVTDVVEVFSMAPEYGEIDANGGEVDGLTASYVCYGGSYEVEHHVQDGWHITAQYYCSAYGILWYECWDTDDGDYYGWIDSSYLDFYD